MEDISRDLEKDITSAAKPVRVRIGRHWQVLFVDDHGEMITVKWVKPLAIALIGLLVISIGICIAFLSFYMNGSAENQAIQNQLTQSEERIKSLRYELDILMARVVLAESKLDKSGDAAPKKTVPADTSKALPSKGKPKQQVPLNPYEEVSGVKVEDLTLTHEIPDNLLRVKFVVKNKERDRGAIAGYVFVILKGDESRQNGWLTIPSVELTKGMPDSVTKGQYFKISHYKTVYLKARRQTAPEKFKMASILVFGPKGTLLYDDTRPVTIKTVMTRRPVEEEPPATGSANDVQTEEKPADEGKAEIPDGEEKIPEVEALPDITPSQDGAQTEDSTEEPTEEPPMYY